MSNSSPVLKIAGAVIAIGVVAALVFAARFVIDPNTARAEYTRIDNAAMMHKDGEYEYTLEAYDESGGAREETFKASKKLREDAFLKLEVMPIRGVVSWEEVQLDEIPQPARDKLEG